MAILTEERTYVAGQWVTGDEVVSVENPADETHVGNVTVTPVGQFERAIAEARRSFDDGVWADLSPADRALVLHRFIDYIEANSDILVPTLVAEAGQPTAFAQMTQVGSGLSLARNTIDLYLSMSHEEASPVPVDELVRGRVALSMRRHEPVGVVAAITPYNAALLMGFQKLIPALMAGNSIILRPSPLTPISSLIFGAAADAAAGLPPGVLSVVVEEGITRCAGLLTGHPADRHGVVHRLHGGRTARSSPSRRRRSSGCRWSSAENPRRSIWPDAVHRARHRSVGVSCTYTCGTGVRGRDPDAGARRPQRLKCWRR